MAQASDTASRSLRSKRSINYRETGEIHLPRPKKVQSKSDQLFPVKVVDKDDSGKRIKIHYVGYSTKYDEWRDECDLEPINEADSSEETECDGFSFEPFSLHSYLKVKIKQSLTCTRKSSPSVRIVVPFDAVTFNGGLRLLGTESKKAQGIQHYTIKHYRDLNPILGKNWHFRGLNVNADYGYVILETLEFFLRKSRSLEEYLPTPGQEEDSGSPSTSLSLVDTGYVLTFMFVCGYGARSTFGKDQKIFC